MTDSKIDDHEMTDVDPRHLCQIMIPTGDRPRALKFFSQVFGWEPVPADIYQLTILRVPTDCPFGIALVEETEPPPPGGRGPLLIFAVDDPQSVLNRYQLHGGGADPTLTIHPGYGHVWSITDPDGHRWGLFQKMTSPASDPSSAVGPSSVPALT